MYLISHILGRPPILHWTGFLVTPQGSNYPFFPLASFNKWCLLVVACQIFSWWSSKLCHRQLSTGSEVGRIVVDLVGSAVCTCVHQVFGILCPTLPSDLSWCRCLENRTLLFHMFPHVLSLTQQGSGQKNAFLGNFPVPVDPPPRSTLFLSLFAEKVRFLKQHNTFWGVQKT